MILQKFRDQSSEIIGSSLIYSCSVKGFGFLTGCIAGSAVLQQMILCVFPDASAMLRGSHEAERTFISEQEILVKDALKVLNKEPDLQPVTETEILKVLYRLVMQDSIVVEENRVYITKQHQEEEDTASMIARKLHEQIPLLRLKRNWRKHRRI